MKKRTILTMASVLVSSSIFMIGCGGSGDSATSSAITGSVQASILEGVSVCIKGTSDCAVTDSSGNYTISGYVPPQVLELKVGNAVIGEVAAASSTLNITPQVLADNNATLAAYVGSMLHKIAGCAITATQCNLSAINDVDINASSTKSLIEELVEEMDSNGTVTFKVDGNDINVTSVDTTEYEIEYPEMVSSTITFQGAASVGDLATYSYDKSTNTLTYDINGSVYQENGSRTLTNLYGNVFFKDTDDNFYFFSKTLAVAQIPLSDGNVSYITGLQMPESDIDTSLVVNKRYNFINFSASDGSLGIGIIDINASSTSTTNGTWLDIVNDINGTWTRNGNHLEILDVNNTKIANGILRPSSSDGRAGFILDNLPAIGGGFGIGVEAKALSLAEIGSTFTYLGKGLNPSDAWSCYGNVTVSDNNDGNSSTASFTFTDDECTATVTPSSGSATLVLNPTVTFANGSIVLEGIVQISTTAFAFIDPESGYYVAFDTNTSDPMISIGSNKPLDE